MVLFRHLQSHIRDHCTPWVTFAFSEMEISPSGRMDITIYNLKISTSDFNVYVWRTDVPFGETVLSANPYIGENFNFNDPSRARIPLPLL